MFKKDFLAYIPIAGTILLFLGFIRKIIYYREFGINNLHFIEVGEIMATLIEAKGSLRECEGSGLRQKICYAEWK